MDLLLLNSSERVDNANVLKGWRVLGWGNMHNTLRPSTRLACSWIKSKSSGPDVSQREIVGVETWDCGQADHFGPSMPWLKFEFYSDLDDTLKRIPLVCGILLKIWGLRGRGRRNLGCAGRRSEATSFAVGLDMWCKRGVEDDTKDFVQSSWKDWRCKYTLLAGEHMWVGAIYIQLLETLSLRCLLDIGYFIEVGCKVWNSRLER